MLLKLPHIFGTCLGWCSEFSCTLGWNHTSSIPIFMFVHFIHHMHEQCGPAASTQVRSGNWMLPPSPLPLLKSKQRRAFGFLHSSCLLLCLWVCVVLHEWSRGCALKCISCYIWLQVWGQSQELLMVQRLTKVSSNPGHFTLYGTWWEEPLNSDLFHLEMHSQLRHWLGKLHFIFLKQKCSPVTAKETGSPLTFDKPHLIPLIPLIWDLVSF